MKIGVLNIWLFKTKVSSPFIFDAIDGLDIGMISDTIINTLTLDFANYKIDHHFKSGLEVESEAGGSDFMPSIYYGKLRKFNTLNFNIPLFDQDSLNKIVGKQWSWIIETTDGKFQVCFGNFRSESVGEDNNTMSSITLETKSSHYIYDINNLTINSIGKTLTCEQLEEGGFDYELDFELE